MVLNEYTICVDLREMAKCYKWHLDRMTVKASAQLALFSKRDLITKSRTILCIIPEGSPELLLPATFVHQFPGQLMKAIFYMH